MQIVGPPMPKKTSIEYNFNMANQEKDLSRLLEILRQELPKLKKEYSIETLEVFGSYVRAEEQTTSDLDLLVTFSELPGLFKYIELENRLSDILGVKVDLVMKDALKPAIGRQIINEAMKI
jgi:hypothetical protein